MKREFSSIIRIAPIRNNQAGEPSTMTTYSEISFDEDPKSSSQGILYEQSLKVAVKRSEAGGVLQLIPRFRALVWLHDGAEYHQWGSVDIPVQVVVLPKTDTVSLEMSCKSLLPLLRG